MQQQQYVLIFWGVMQTKYCHGYCIFGLKSKAGIVVHIVINAFCSLLPGRYIIYKGKAVVSFRGGSLAQMTPEASGFCFQHYFVHKALKPGAVGFVSKCCDDGLGKYWRFAKMICEVDTLTCDGAVLYVMLGLSYSCWMIDSMGSKDIWYFKYLGWCVSWVFCYCGR